MARAQAVDSRLIECRAVGSSNLSSDQPLECDVDSNVNAGIHRVAKVIHAVDVDNIKVLRVEPVTWPRVNECERISAVFEAVIAVIALANSKCVFPSKIGPITVVGNAVTVTTLGSPCGLSLL